jgi:adenylate cyclase
MRTTMFRLAVWIGDRLERELSLREGETVFGRDPTCDLPIAHPTLSRRHGRLIREGAQVFVEDLGSTNGLLVNEVTTHGRRELSPGDAIRVGEIRIVLAEEGSAAPDGAENAADVDELMREYSLRSSRDESLQPANLDRVRAPRMFYTLYDISKRLGAEPSVERLLDAALAAILRVMPADRGFLVLADPDSGELAVRFGRAREGGLTNPGSQVVSMTVVRTAVEARKAILAADARSDPRFGQQRSILGEDIRSILCAPLWDEEQVYGAIYLDAVGRRAAFAEEDRALLAGIANLIAIRLGQERLRERLAVEARMRLDLSRYHSPDVVDLLLSRQGTLEPGRRLVTVLVADIAGSTGLAERLGEAGVHSLLHRFYEMAAESIFRRQGHLNKFLGDGVLAVFNAPLEVDRHELLAVEAALDLVGRVESFGRERPDHAFRIRAGVNTGPVIAGNIGPANRLEYTVIGDAVNVAERLSKIDSGSGVAVGEETWRGLGGAVPGADLGEFPVRGRAGKVRVFEIGKT